MDSQPETGGSAPQMCGDPEGLLPPTNTDAIRDRHPLASIWTQPRATMRHIINTEPRKYFYVLMIAGAFFNLLDRASTRSMGDRWPLWVIFVLSLVIAPLAIPLSRLGAMMMCWAGGKLGGVATRDQVRASFAWAAAPMIMFGVVGWPIHLALYGREMFTKETPLMDDSNPFILLAVFGTAIIAGVWSIVVGLKVYGEVNQFSAWRSLGAGALMVAAIFIPMTVIVTVLYVLLGGRSVI